MLHARHARQTDNGREGEEETQLQSPALVQDMTADRPGPRERRKAALFHAVTLCVLACIGGLSLELATGCFHLLDGPSRPLCGSGHDSTLSALRGTSGLRAQASKGSVLDCKSVSSASGVSSPYLVADQSTVNNKDGPSLYAFYQLQNKHGVGEIGVACSQDLGLSWVAKGTVLKGRHSLASPWMAYDLANGIYVMLPVVQGLQHGGSRVDLFTTSARHFPRGWQRQAVMLQQDLDLHGDGADVFEASAAVFFDDRWWIFVTVREQSPSNHFKLRLFHAANLTHAWEEHPSSPVSRDQRYARNGGRPVVMEGSVHRWAQDNSAQAGHALHLLKLELSTSSYTEMWVATRLTPEGSTEAPWHQIRHIDVLQVGPSKEWVGLMEAATAPPGPPPVLGGRSQVHARRSGLENWLTWLRGLLVAVLLVVWAAWPALAAQGNGGSGGAMRAAALGQQRMHGPRSPRAASMLDVFMHGPELGKKLDGSPAATSWRARALHLWALAAKAWSQPGMQMGTLLLAALSTSALLFLIIPKNFQCPRWAIKVSIQPSPHGGHVDTAAPFFPVPPPPGVLMVISAANAPFFDRLENMVASVQAWAPKQRMAVYDLGFLQQQLLDMACWQDVEVRPFVFPKYPPHVRELGNYAFKALAIQDALVLNSLVLWIDAGLELRAPMHTMLSWLSQHGHVSALQEDNIGDAMYTRTKGMVDAMGLSRLWPHAASWQFCAGGLQGFVRGSDAERLILGPVVNCSLRASCIAPLGASRLDHNFDQTAFTLAIRAHNYTCLPRETHCMWSTKKAARAPMQPSQPIEVVSRGHRLPKPYTPLLKRRPGCSPLQEGLVPWAPQSAVHAPSWHRYSLGFRVQKVYLQPVGDFLVQAAACVDAHCVAQILFWLLYAAVGGGCLPVCRALHDAWWHAASHRRLAVHLLGVALAVLALHATLLDLAARAH